jgi:hypothetical protein
VNSVSIFVARSGWPAAVMACLAPVIITPI